MRDLLEQGKLVGLSIVYRIFRQDREIFVSASVEMPGGLPVKMKILQKKDSKPQKHLRLTVSRLLPQ